ncbi:MAG: hypothetical protein QF926_13365 [Alphaproteobacteria bacterium]|jgi:hypothetical protein|nr:hypothetical protein [Alphaproteobacteria bacterium]MDP6517590.1 hypothetical protein [Alphaproteobacteria bacterium]|tara:strand:+ start:729 stop:854 length:126 start_codon:yes stop_codon:yes gene_type:complete
MTEQRIESLQVGDPAPSFAVAAVADDGQIQLDDYVGRPRAL